MFVQGAVDVEVCRLHAETTQCQRHLNLLLAFTTISTARWWCVCAIALAIVVVSRTIGVRVVIAAVTLKSC